MSYYQKYLKYKNKYLSLQKLNLQNLIWCESEAEAEALNEILAIAKELFNKENYISDISSNQ